MSAGIIDARFRFRMRRGMANLRRQFWLRHGWDRIPVPGPELDAARLELQRKYELQLRSACDERRGIE